MATLDKFIAAMFEKEAAALLLESGQQVMLEVDGEQRPISKDPVATPKILALVREIMPEGTRAQLESGEGRVSFRYVADKRQVDVEMNRSGADISGVFTPARPRRSTAAMAIPAETLSMEGTVRSEPPAEAHRRASVATEAADQAEERVQELLRHVVETDSSDLHLRVGLPPTYRTYGDLKSLDDAAPLARDEIQEMLMAIMPERNKQEYAETNDTDFAYEILDVARFRANAFRDRMGPGAAFRLIPTELISAGELGLSPEVQKLCYLSKGLVVVTGPTGSGKSTTLAALIDLINETRSDHIVTIEDPIEFVHPNKKCIVTQRQVGSHTQSFKRALRAALRADPDVVLIGEMRDLETVAIAIETAETGHLVFGTLHTNTAVSAIDRIIDQFPADRQSQIRVMLSESLKGVVAQTLCKKVGGGRIAAFEVLLTIGAVSNLIREGKTFQLPSIIQTNKKVGMLTLNDSLIELVKSKTVESQEAYLKAADKKGFEGMLKSQGIKVDTVE